MNTQSKIDLSKATKRPWHLLRLGERLYVESKDSFVCDMQLESRRGNSADEDRVQIETDAAFIVQAVNSFEAMRDALEAIQAGFIDGSIRWARPRRSDNEPYHPANALLCRALALTKGEWSKP